MYKGKIVEVRRHFSLIEMQQSDPSVSAWLGESWRGAGPYFAGKATATGLSFEEQKILLPEHLGVEHSDKDFRKTVNKFYDEICTSVPKDGLRLQVSLQNDNEPLSSSNLPINLDHYIRFRHLLNHPQVASSKAAAEQSWQAKYYIHDAEGVTQHAMFINTLEDRATEVYTRFKDDPIKTDQILTMLGVDIVPMKSDAKLLKLKGYAKKDPALNDIEQKTEFERFLRVANDKDLEFKYLIQEMIGAQYLKRVGNNILYAESGKEIGVSMEDAVLYFKNPKNSRELNLLRAQYLSKLKYGESYLPKEVRSPGQTIDPDEVLRNAKNPKKIDQDITKLTE